MASLHQILLVQILITSFFVPVIMPGGDEPAGSDSSVEPAETSVETMQVKPQSVKRLISHPVPLYNPLRNSNQFCLFGCVKDAELYKHILRETNHIFYNINLFGILDVSLVELIKQSFLDRMMFILSRRIESANLESFNKLISYFHLLFNHLIRAHQGGLKKMDFDESVEYLKKFPLVSHYITLLSWNINPNSHFWKTISLEDQYESARNVILYLLGDDKFENFFQYYTKCQKEDGCIQQNYVKLYNVRRGVDKLSKLVVENYIRDWLFIASIPDDIFKIDLENNFQELNSKVKLNGLLIEGYISRLVSKLTELDYPQESLENIKKKLSKFVTGLLPQ